MKEVGKTKWKGQPFGNCFPPSSEDDEFVVAKDFGISFTYDVPVITSITPSRSLNIPGKTARVTISGQNFGFTAREIFSPQCEDSTSRSCRQIFMNGVVLFNHSCSSIELLSTGATGADVALDVGLSELAWCNSPQGYTVVCTAAFSELYTECVERCLDPFAGCGRRCPEDRVICDIPVLGGTQEVSLVVAGVTAKGSVSFQYDAPIIYSVTPPEVLAGTSSLLTVTGINFGDYLAVRYAGREIFVGPDTVVPTVLKPYGEGLTRNLTTLQWWDDAQFQTCFSNSLPEGSPDIPVQQRFCNAGRVLSSSIGLSDVFAFGEEAQRMVVQGPVVKSVEGQTLTQVDIMAQSMGLRSEITPENSSFSFRVACNTNERTIGSRIHQFYLGSTGPGQSALASSALVSHGERLWLLGGQTITQTESSEVWRSMFTGLGWSSVTADRTWWSARHNVTACTFRDVLYLMGGASHTEQKAFNDVWVFAETAEVDAYFWRPGIPSPNLVAGQAYSPYWIRITDNAPWSARSRAQCLVHNDSMWLLGGVGYAEPGQYGEWTTDLWRTRNGFTWELVTAKGLWQGRNNIRAVIHTDGQVGMWLVASVQEQFYNTMFSIDGVNWQFPENACALTNVDVQDMVAWRGYMFLFTTACHDLDDDNQDAVPCGSRPSAQSTQNRIWYSQNGRSWLLARRPYMVDTFLRPDTQPYGWQGTEPGEFRYAFHVAIHKDTMYIVGGFMHRLPRVGGQLATDADGNFAYIESVKEDLWMCKSFLESTLLCNDKSDQGLSGEDYSKRTFAEGPAVGCA
eukprot:CAMPEP_0169433038 /NCGR_PEP_ID=MMETSP1042-20121227/3800_1 /TAXON_ID=464988 /ORGANISM="Hemiselmis andersenii, Strain CCMP1180" /LENGTH=794 /DNA_ID=CAMNT_0009543555 /DNA_START=227 /DNA_END=2608 /DNA_ORIENTATION=+